ncbi:MAG: hypothetical protein ACRDKS_01685, partial [Actinomycetota bacterium]
LQPHLHQYVAELDAQANFASPEIGGYLQYPMEPLLALAPLWTDPDRQARLAGWARWLTDEVAHPGVLQFGERIFRIADRTYLHSIGFPHIWSGAETYLAAAFVLGVQGCPVGQHIGEAICRG